MISSPVSENGFQTGWESDYQTPDLTIGPIARRFPTPVFYLKLLKIVLDAGRTARRRGYGDGDWISSSRRTLQALEAVGVRVTIEGTGGFIGLESPCVFAANHMSVLETFVLPGIIRPHRKVTFVTKKELLAYPAFGPVLASRRPIVVSRQDPRRDLQAVLKEGAERLRAGISVIVFPQNTRLPVFDPNRFNSLGVKLARRAGVAVVPVALQTGAWGTGKWLKDFGRISPEIPVRMIFGEAIPVRGNGRETQEKLVGFISRRLG
jgi:1-acyl-sn-glycerol-3-phosphate acyltransferase